jgi:hypothetical protein
MSQLSSGKWHLKVPREYEANLKFRRRLLDLCRHDKKAQQAVIYACKNDILFFINCFILQYNPLVIGETSVGPFITYGFQEKALLMEPPVGKGILWAYENRRTAVVEKSREMGASWLFLMFQVWLCLFYPHVQSLNISRSEEAVDSASRDSLFEKIRFMIEHLPDWLKGEVSSRKKHFKFRRSGSEITGVASTGKSGAGGRGSVVFIDEFSLIEEDVEVRRNTASISDCRFFNGTHTDVSSEFYNLTEQAKGGEFVHIRMHWTQHPKKNTHLYSFDVDRQMNRYWLYDDILDEIRETKTPTNRFPEDYNYNRTGQPSGGCNPGIRSVWYDAKSVAIGSPRAVAMDLDINPSGAASQFYDGTLIGVLMRKCRDPIWTGELLYDFDECRPIQFSSSESGRLKMWIEPTTYGPEGYLSKIQPSSYVIAGDVSYGVGSTPTCFTIFDVIRGQKVGVYVNAWIDAKQMAHYMVALCRIFKDIADRPALLGWETPGPGLIFGGEVYHEIGFKNIYWNVNDPFSGARKESENPGWNATTKAKVNLHGEYYAALRTGEFVNWDKASLEETLSYVHYKGTVEHPKSRKNEDASAEGSNHGDRVVADGLAWLMAKRQSSFIREEAVPEIPNLPNSIAGRIEYNRRKARENAPIWGRY